MTPLLLLAIYCVLIILSSLVGGWLPSALRLTHSRMQMAISFVGGLMLGVGLWHMLPHAVVELGSLDTALIWTMVGLLGMFFLIRTFHFHQHDVTVPSPVVDQLATQTDETHEHGPACEAGHHHGHDHGHDHGHHHGEGHRLSWVGIALGLAIHTLIDGVALAASVQSETGASGEVLALGVSLGTFLAIALHKPLDSLSITMLMRAGGWNHRAQMIVNGVYALMCPAGVVIFYLSVESLGQWQTVAVGCALAFSAGVFLCISLSDLLPELQFHSHDRFKLSAALLLGVAMAYGIGFLEPEHAHGHGHGHSHSAGDHDHGHSHVPGQPHDHD